MLALAGKEEKALIIDEVIVSEKVITAGTDISALTMADFANPLTYGISSKVQSDNQFSVKSVITNHWQDSANTDHTTNKDFNVALVGVVAHVDSFADQHVLTVAVGNDPFVLPAYQGTDVSFVFGITQAYSASQNVTIKMDGSAYALATDLDDIKNLQGSIGIAIDSKLADYVKTDDVKNLIPATVIDGSKPADFKEAVTLEKGATDGAGNAIATAKDLADGDTTTLKSAKDYADTQAGDKVKTADTANWQKAKISADDGSPKSFLYAKDNGNITMWIAGRPLGIHTFWCAAGVTGNPVSSSIQGTMSISSVKNGVGYCVSADGDFISITLVDGQVSYSALANAANVVDRNPDTGTVSKPTDFTNLTVNGGKSVATRDDLKSLEASAWRPLKLLSSTSGAVLFKDNGDGTASLTGSAMFNVATSKDNFVAEVDAPDGYVFTSVDWKINIDSSTQIIGINSQYAISETGSSSSWQALKVRIQDGNLLIGGSNNWNQNNLITFNAFNTNLKTVSLAGSPATIGITKLN